MLQSNEQGEGGEGEGERGGGEGEGEEETGEGDDSSIVKHKPSSIDLPQLSIRLFFPLTSNN